jgi:hypothetical protein
MNVFDFLHQIIMKCIKANNYDKLHKIVNRNSKKVNICKVQNNCLFWVLIVMNWFKMHTILKLYDNNHLYST